MKTANQTRDQTEIQQLMNAYHEAMVAARTKDLDKLVDTDFTLTHITGYVQPKHEWLGVIRSGQFDYHHIDIDEKTTSLSILEDSASLSGRGIFNATINGMKSPWRLQFSIQLRKLSGRWVMKNARYTTF
jgi:hypothetical protein